MKDTVCPAPTALPEALRRYEDDVAGVVDEIQLQGGLDQTPMSKGAQTDRVRGGQTDPSA